MLPASFRALASGRAQDRGPAPRWLFLGTDKGEGVYRAAWDPTQGKLGVAELAAATDRPDFLALHPRLPVLYAINAVSGAKAGVSAYRIDPAHGTLTLMNRLATQGDGPCFVSADRTAKMAFVANYSAGSLSSFALNEDGSLKSRIGVFQNKQAEHGPVSDRQDAAHLHSCTLSPGNDFVVVCDLGSDTILLFPIHPGTNSAIGAPVSAAARPGSGPRHVAFHPNGRWLYCIHELDCTVDLYDWNATNQSALLNLRSGSTVSTLAEGKQPQADTASEIAVSDDGHFVYACTRTENSLAVFRIDPQSGLLSLQQHLGCGGAIPRYFALDPSRRWLLCCNQGDSTVTVFAHDARTGQIDPRSQTFPANTPMFCVWV